MAIALVSGQTANSSTNSSVTSITVTLPNNPAQGNLVVAMFVIGSAASGTASVKDSNNNSYAATTHTPFTMTSSGLNPTRIGMWYLQNAPANASKTVTFSVATGSDVMGGYVAEFSGAATSGVLETDATGNPAGASTTINTPSITTVNNGDLLINIACSAGSTLGSISSVNAPFTAIQTNQTAFFDMWAEFFIQSTAGAQAPNYTQTSNQYAVIAGAFIAVTTGPVGAMIM